MGVRAGARQEDQPAVVQSTCARLGYGVGWSPRALPRRAPAPTRHRRSRGAFIRDAAVVQPARLARGLRRFVLDRGVRIFERIARVTASTGRARRSSAPDRAVRSVQIQVVLAHGAWAAGWRDFARASVIVEITSSWMELHPQSRNGMTSR